MIATDGAVGTAEPEADATGSAEDAARGRRRLLVVAGLTALVMLPLVVALVPPHSPRWYPLLDLAMTELRVRDVGTRHSPLTGLVGRLSYEGNLGSHPGPISFWALAPVYRLLGSSAWTLLVGVVVLNTTAVALTLWIALRRGGTMVALGFAAALAVLAHLYGTRILTEPWNPYLPVMWWVLTLVALWAVLCDDLAMLPVAVVAGTFCMQTHVSYLGLVGGLVALGLVLVAVRAVMLRGDRAALRRLAMWCGISFGLAFVLWLPPLIDQITNDPGNATIVFGHFRHPQEDPIGFGRGTELVGAQLNPWRFVIGQQAISGSIVPAVALVAGWGVAAIATWRLPAPAPGDADGDHRGALRRLHVVVAVALVLVLVSASRILGFVWHYLSLWTWGVTMLMVVAVVWSAVALASSARPRARRTVRRLGPMVLVGVLAMWTAVFAVAARDAEPTQNRLSGAVGDLALPVLAAIDDGEVTSAGRDGRYLVTWTDGTYIGSPGFGLVDELERRGLDVGVTEVHEVEAVAHRVLPATEADAEVHVSVGPDIEVWRARPDAVELAYVDIRTDEERVQFERARAETIAQLERLGRDDLIRYVDEAPFGLYLDESLPDETRQAVAPLADEVGNPLAVFIGPPPVAAG